VTAWAVSRIHVVEGGWSWEIACDGVPVLVAAEAIRNPASCAIAAERFRRDLEAGRIVLDEDGDPIEGPGNL
jgi:hypothetical protein